MKKVLLGVLIIFTILTLSSYASAQVYIRQIGDWCWNNFTDGLLYTMSFNLMTNAYCWIQASGWYEQDDANCGAEFWLRVNGNDFYDLSSVEVESFTTANLTVPFQTVLGLYFYRGTHTVDLLGNTWCGTADICRYSIIVTCGNRGALTTDHP